MGHANSLQASALYREYNERFDLILSFKNEILILQEIRVNISFPTGILMEQLKGKNINLQCEILLMSLDRNIFATFGLGYY